MKTLNITFTNEEFKKLKKAKKLLKGNVGWHKFIIAKCTKGVSVKREANKQ